MTKICKRYFLSEIGHVQLHGGGMGKHTVRKKSHSRHTEARPLTIGMQVAYLFEGCGGIERFCVTLAHYLLAQGHTVHFFCRTLPGKTKPGYALNSKIVMHMYDNVGTTTYREEWRTKVQQLGLDVFLSTVSNSADFLWPSILAGTGIPLFVSEHSNPWIIEKEKWCREQRLATFAMGDVRHVLLKSYAASLPESLHAGLTVLPNPVRRLRPRQEPATQRRQYRIVAVGRLHNTIKQHSLLIQAFSRIAPSFPAWVCVIYGEGKDREALEALVANLGLHERCLLPGITEHIDQELYASDVFCQPSRYEGFPLAVVEAMAAGLPCVGFAESSGVNSLIRHEHTGRLATHMTAESLAEQLACLMQNADERARMGANARVAAAEYAEEVMLPLWESALRQCAKQRGKTAADMILSEDTAAVASLQALCSSYSSPSSGEQTKIESVQAYVWPALVQERVERLRALRTSFSWRITAPLRAICKALGVFV